MRRDFEGLVLGMAIFALNKKIGINYEKRLHDAEVKLWILNGKRFFMLLLADGQGKAAIAELFSFKIICDLCEGEVRDFGNF